jgi:hypothetical protein
MGIRVRIIRANGTFRRPAKAPQSTSVSRHATYILDFTRLRKLSYDVPRYELVSGRLEVAVSWEAPLQLDQIDPEMSVEATPSLARTRLDDDYD